MKATAPSAARNVGPIVEVLAQWLPAHGRLVELASGTGEHALAFAQAFPGLTVQPSDVGEEALASIAAWREDGPANLRPPVRIDVCDAHWPVTEADAVVAINLIHISPWAAAIGLLDGTVRTLVPGGMLILYGPWRVAGEPLIDSNTAFDADLKARNPEWGLRPLGEFTEAAAARGLVLEERREMPANNLSLRFRRVHAGD